MADHLRFLYLLSSLLNFFFQRSPLSSSIHNFLDNSLAKLSPTTNFLHSLPFFVDYQTIAIFDSVNILSWYSFSLTMHIRPKIVGAVKKFKIRIRRTIDTFADLPTVTH